MSVLLDKFQRQLQRIYEVEVPHAVGNFLTSDREWVNQVDNGERARDTQEKLLLVQRGQDLELALYIDRSIVKRLEHSDPTKRLHPGNLADYWVAVEGVSHFLYLTWNAGFEREISLLELELQAEVDRYISSAFLYGRQDAGRIPVDLYERLFGEPTYEEGLDSESLQRYQRANHYASLYCRHLEERYLRSHAAEGMVNELRRFYRLTQRQKINRIESTG